MPESSSIRFGPDIDIILPRLRHPLVAKRTRVSGRHSSLSRVTDALPCDRRSELFVLLSKLLGQKDSERHLHLLSTDGEFIDMYDTQDVHRSYDGLLINQLLIAAFSKI